MLHLGTQLHKAVTALISFRRAVRYHTERRKNLHFTGDIVAADKPSRRLRAESFHISMGVKLEWVPFEGPFA